MDQHKFNQQVKPLLKYNVKRERYYVKDSSRGSALCDLCSLTVHNPGWDLYPWKMHTNRARIRIICRICKLTKHIPLRRTDLNSQNKIIKLHRI